MRCPHCHLKIPDESIICPSCDAVLDSGYFDAGGAPVDDEEDSVPDGGQAPMLGVEDDEPVAPAAGGTSILRLDPEAEKQTRIVKLSDVSGKRVAAARAADQASDEEELGDFWGQVGLAYRRLWPFEKLALWSLVALFVGAFLPWFYVRGEGFVSGVEQRGTLSAALSFVAIVVFWVRVTLRQVLLVLVQVAFVVGAALVAGFALMRPLPSHSPRFGLYLTVAFGVVAAVISLVGAVKR
jgi:hypothetical protein